MSEHVIRSHRRPSRQTHRLRTGIISTLAALVLATGALSLSHQPAAQQIQPVDLVLPAGAPDELGQWCVDHNTAAFRATLSGDGRRLLKGCVELWGAGLSPSPTPSPSATQTPSPSPSTTVAPTTTSPPASTTPPATTPPATTTPPPSPSPTPTAPAGWPSPSTVGVPAGTVLTNYSGPCTITVPNTVLDARWIGCTLTIATTGVVITRSIVDGGILTGRSNATGQPVKVTVEDSRLIGHGSTRGIDGSAYVVLRSHLSGDTSGGWCWRSCLVEQSYIEGSGDHTSAFRLQRDGVMRGNVLWCKRGIADTDGGCSSDLTSYADVIDGQQTVIDNNVLTGNLFKATPGWYCMRAGFGTNWAVTGNTFEVGAGRCSEQSGGGPVDAWGSGVWSDNRYTDGRLVTV